MNRLRELLGKEHESDSLNRTLRDFSQGQKAAAVGAVHVTCSDECEREAAESFQHWFAESLLPELKFWSRAPFRLANLGGRYEWGAVPIAEQHFATPETRDRFKLLVVKLNSHVSVTGEHGRPRFGTMDRYASKSVFCGALHALLDGQPGPSASRLREAFESEGKRRLEMIQDPDQTDPHLRSLLVAIVNARLQARLATVDIQNHVPHTPTLYLVLSCVTLNRKQRDAELVVGCYLADCRGGTCNVQYYGLDDDPSKYHVSLTHDRVWVEDQSLHHPREARDHRQEILSIWMQRRLRPEAIRDKRLDEIARQVAGRKHHDPKLAREILTTLAWLLLDLSPIPMSVLLFAKGVAGAHHLYRVHRLARGDQDRHAARAIVDEFLANVDKLPPEQVRAITDTLLEHHHANGHCL